MRVPADRMMQPAGVCSPQPQDRTPTMAEATNRTTEATVDAAVPATDATSPAADAGAASATSSFPQVGDLTPRGVIAGVRNHSDGRCEISFDGAAWQPL
jgi:hypothetical protein